MSDPHIVVASQPRYLPSCAYLHRALLADAFVYLDTVQFTPRDWESRNRIKASAGPAWLTVPVVHVSRRQRVADTVIDDTQDWRRRHLRSLELSYRRAPFFEEVFALVREVLERPWARLLDLNATLVEALLGYLGVSARFVVGSTLGPIDATGQELLLELCRRLDAHLYLSGPLGRDYLEPSRFREQKIGLAFHDYVPAEYPQLFGGFVPNLSAVDLLFNCGRASLSHIERGNVTRADLLRQAVEAG
jgi:WbqC-like protein family